MGAIEEAFARTYRDFTVAGVAGSGTYKPAKQDIRRLGSTIEQFVTSFNGGSIYPDTAAGLAATENGQLFLVVATGDEFARLYLNNAGVAEFQGVALPSSAALEGKADQDIVDSLNAGLAEEVTRSTAVAAEQGQKIAVQESRPIFNGFFFPVGDDDNRAVWVAGEDDAGRFPIWGDQRGRVHMTKAGDDMIEAVGGTYRGFTFGMPAVVVDENGIGFDIEPPLSRYLLAFEIDAGDHRDVALIDVATNRTCRLTYGDGDNFAIEKLPLAVRWVRQSGSALAVREQPIVISGATNLAAGMKRIRQVGGLGNSLAQAADSYPAGDPDGVVSPGRVMEFAAGVNPGGNGLDTPATGPQFGSLNDMENGAFLSTESDAGTTMFPRMLAGCLPAVAADDAFLGTILGKAGAGYVFLKKGSVYYANMLTAILKGRLLAFVDDLDHRVDFFTLLHGEADRGAFKADYLSYLVEWQDDFQADLRAVLMNDAFVLPFILSQTSGWTYYNDIASGRCEVPLAQLQAAQDQPAKFVCVGPRYHLEYYDGGPHLTRDGQRRHADEFARAERALLSSYDAAGNANGSYMPLHVASGTRAGTTVTLQTAGGVGNLVIDTALVTDPGNYGITYRDGSGNDVAVSNVAILDAATGTIRFTIASAVAGFAGMAVRGVNGAAPGRTSGPRACFRDSSPEVSTVDGQRLYKHICHGEVAIA